MAPTTIEPSVRLEQARLSDHNTVAVVAGEALSEVPKDLYIPPEALEVFLETFEGPHTQTHAAQAQPTSGVFGRLPIQAEMFRRSFRGRGHRI